MLRLVRFAALTGAIVGAMAAAAPAFAAKVFDTQVGKFDLDPFNILAPAEAPAPAPEPPAPAKKKKHHHRKM